MTTELSDESLLTGIHSPANLGIQDAAAPRFSESRALPLVSIIINNYNYERFVGTAIGSALAQTHKPVEVIVVDDGSTDSSRGVIAGFGNQLKAIFKTNGGQASAYNTGFAVSKGDFVCLLDADDFLKPHAIETAVRNWQPSMSKVHFPLEIVDENGVPTGAINPTTALHEGTLVQQITSRGYYTSAPGTGNLYSRAFLTAVMPNPDTEPFRKAADTYLNYQAPFYGKIGAVHSPLAFYRSHSASSTFVSIGNDEGRIRQLRKLLFDDDQRSRIIEKMCRQFDLPSESQIAAKNLWHLKLRLSLAKLSPKDSMFPSDTPTGVLLQTLRTAWSSQEISRINRTLFALWALAAAAAPSGLAGALVDLGLTSNSRGRITNALLSCSRGAGRLRTK